MKSRKVIEINEWSITSRTSNRQQKVTKQNAINLIYLQIERLLTSTLVFLWTYLNC